MFHPYTNPRQPPVFNQRPHGPRFLYYKNRGLENANSFPAPNRKPLSPYKWIRPPPPAAFVPPHAPRMPSGHKRRMNEYNNPPVVKHQRLDFSPDPSLAPPAIWRPRFPGPAVGQPPRPSLRQPPRPSLGQPPRPSLVGSHQVPSSPNFSHHPQGLSVTRRVFNINLYANDTLSGQMVEMFEACQQQPSDLEKKEIIRANLLEEIKKRYKGARLYLTGSSMSGLACRTSDADLCLVVEQTRRASILRVLSRLRDVFKNLPYISTTDLIKAKVPILRFREKDSNVEFDLNINNTVGIRNTFLLKSYAHADARVKPLILVIKKWARHHKINDASKGTLSSYTLVLMVLHYLQILNEPVLPSLQRDHPDCFDPLMEIDSVPESSSYVPSYSSRNESSLGELFLGFLQYYSTQFSWSELVISVKEATTFLKTKSWGNKPICVEEPFDGKNVARAVYEKVKFKAIKAQFVESYHSLFAKMDLNAILPVRAIIEHESQKS
uniref:polynucleotide adenylyltransferase n=1 Tax=Nothobranchius korthausae TaxID=1143690 RepID=A0A1A8ESK6_9TELE